MEYKQVASLLNRILFEGDKLKLLESLAKNPERFVGLFRPTRPKAKMLQYLTQSHEIRFGDVMETLHETILADAGYTNLDKSLVGANGDDLNIDLYFTDHHGTYYFVELKVRDDHDSTKKRGQIANFKSKLEILHNRHGESLIGAIYFVDPSLSKNKNYYLGALELFKTTYTPKLYLVYGKEFFELLRRPVLWDRMIAWLTLWKEDLPEFPEIDLDLDPIESFSEIKNLSPRYWLKILNNDQLWDDEIIRVLFSDGSTLKLVLEHYKKLPGRGNREIAYLLSIRVEEYY